MLADTMSLSIPFESLVKAVKDLSLDEKYRLWELLEEQIAQIEEEERDPSVLAEIDAARKEYQAGDYETIDEYVARRKERASYYSTSGIEEMFTGITKDEELKNAQ